jgi:hypothetical protein
LEIIVDYCGICCGLIEISNDYSYTKCSKCGDIIYNFACSDARNNIKKERFFKKNLGDDNELQS